jgi:hypothetical protein
MFGFNGPLQPKPSQVDIGTSVAPIPMSNEVYQSNYGNPCWIFELVEFQQPSLWNPKGHIQCNGCQTALVGPTMPWSFPLQVNVEVFEPLLIQISKLNFGAF